VTQKSSALRRKEAANALIEKLHSTQPVLIQQATLISNELNRSAILLPEVWQEAIEEASRIYFGRNDGKAMFNYLDPLHKAMEVEPETMNEIAFYQGYAADLLEGYEWMKRYMVTNAIQDIN
jgi:FKBP12-rapamycin complex-associated protein